MITKDKFNEEFENCRKHLKSYILRITTSTDDTEDIIQDTYVKASSKLDTFRGDASLKTWIFTIGSNLAIDLLRSKKRWPENVTDICKDAALSNPQFLKEMMNIRTTSQQGNFEIKEHITFCFTCVGKSLPIEQQVTLLLKEIYNFKVKDVALIVNISEAMVKYYLHTARSKMTDIFENRCSLINKEGVCHQCSELNGIFNPKQNTQEEIMKLEMAKDAENKDKKDLFDLRLKIVKSIDPYESNASELQLHHLNHNNKVMENFLKKGG